MLNCILLCVESLLLLSIFDLFISTFNVYIVIQLFHQSPPFHTTYNSSQSLSHLSFYDNSPFSVTVLYIRLPLVDVVCPVSLYFPSSVPRQLVECFPSNVPYHSCIWSDSFQFLLVYSSTSLLLTPLIVLDKTVVI